jgi:DNA-binding transcriptional regulator YdaS (Cro superfamily)
MFEVVVATYGGQIGLSRLFCVSRAAANQWVKAGGFPARRALQIEHLSKGRFKALDIVLASELDIDQEAA